jgi:hypothetical protein
VTTPGGYNTVAPSTGTASTGSGLAVQAATPAAGAPLINGTQTFLSWTTPNDGKNHAYLIFGGESVTSAQTGGSVNLAFTAPDGSAQNFPILGPALAVGYSLIDASYQTMGLAAPGTTVSITQATAQTAGVAKLDVQIWGL